MISAHVETTADIAIVGAGPAGLFAAYCAGFRGLSVVLIDAYEAVGGQVAVLYPNKRIFDVPATPGITGAQLVSSLHEQAAAYAPTYILGKHVESINDSAGGNGLSLDLSDGQRVTCQAVVITTGVGGIEPRPLPAGTEWLGRGAGYTVANPQAHEGQDVVVVGGGDSALDWANELAPHARSVTVVHRRKQFRAHQGSMTLAEQLGVELVTDAQLVAATGDQTIESVTLSLKGGEERVLPCDLLVGALGLLSDTARLASWGLEMHDRRIVVDRSMHTNRHGIFAAGDATWYPGKVALMVTGFGEAATAVNNAAVLLDPEAELAPGHSTDINAS